MSFLNTDSAVELHFIQLNLVFAGCPQTVRRKSVLPLAPRVCYAWHVTMLILDCSLARDQLCFKAYAG